jgi:hypothetical protein
MSNLEKLNLLLATGRFHHATYRNVGTLWEGLWIYERSVKGFRGFDVATSFPKGDPNLDAAHELVKGKGVSVGSYGKG